ncbi:hypothetical protein FSP39_003701 [Pinctada imbricata]|uniref:Uncharacterized protein n=1 Tax=Pinctada imbricata TaxID=66713 RepID=A0AA89BT03_PINIB|nr:hypothetical protein FSP39_003701 [Pinctada imbricata]
MKRTECVTWEKRQQLNNAMFNEYHKDVQPIEQAGTQPPLVPPPVYPGGGSGGNLPPNPGSTHPIAGNIFVGVSMHLASLNDINEMSGTMSTVAYLTLRWRDPRLRWDPDIYDQLRRISLPMRKIWVPNILLANPVGKFSTIGFPDSEAEIHFTGEVVWKIGDFLQTACDIDITHFPFDRQTCAIDIKSATPMREIKLIPSRKRIYTSFMGSNGAWTLKGTRVDLTVRNDTGVLSFKLNLERRSTFFVMNLFVPVVVLILLNSFVFILPADSGERTGFAITCMLAIAVFLTLVSETLPKTSKPLSVLSFILMLCLILSTCASIMTIISLYIHHKEETKPVPKLVQKFFSMKICRCICCCCGKLKRSFKTLVSRVSKICKSRVREETKSASSVRSIIVESPKGSTLDMTKNFPGDVASLRRVSSVHVENLDLIDEDEDMNSRCKDPLQVLSSLGENGEIEPNLTSGDKVKEREDEDLEEDEITWKIVAKKFDFFCFISVNAMAGALGTLYFMISSGRL